MDFFWLWNVRPQAKNHAATPKINVDTKSTTLSSTRLRVGPRSDSFSGFVISSMMSGSGSGSLPVSEVLLTMAIQVDSLYPLTVFSLMSLS